VILTDAGPLVALIDRGERDHARCRALLEKIEGPLLTTWPALTEAMYLLGSAAGWLAQEKLWRLLSRGDLVVHVPETRELARTRDLMERYSDLPMDLADASLVAAAESLGEHRVFTLDSHFEVYRIAGRRGFEIVPGATSGLGS
jgi:predicted nucleic acid-binding protein